MPSSGPRGAPFPRRGPARARRPDPAGTGRPGGIRRFARHGGVEPPSTVLETVGPPPSRWRVHCFRSSVFNHAMPAVSAAAWHGMRPEATRPTERVPPACPIDSGRSAGPGCETDRNPVVP